MDDAKKIYLAITHWATEAVEKNKFDGASVYSPENADSLANFLVSRGFGDTALASHRARVLAKAISLLRNEGLINAKVDEYIALAEQDLLEEMSE